jgi:hypothetical protein
MAVLSLGRTRPGPVPANRTCRRAVAGASIRPCVITVVHNPEDSRIRQRQIDALISAGWQVTRRAPFHAFRTWQTGCSRGA